MNTVLKEFIYQTVLRVLSEGFAATENVVQEQELDEGGLGGHMSHLYDNDALTFGELKKIFLAAGAGKLENVTEKLDGQNLFVTFNVAEGTVKVARNKGMLATGGINAAGIATKWSDSPVIAEAFTTAFQIINQSMLALPRKVLASIFGPNGNVWFSVEVIYPKSANVINYDKNVIVFHRSGTMIDATGKSVDNPEIEANFNLLLQQMEKMQQNIANSNWNIMGPVLVPLKKLSSAEPVKRAIAGLTALQGKHGLSDKDQLAKFIDAEIVQQLAPLKLPANVVPQVVAIIADRPGKPNINALKKVLSPEQMVGIQKLREKSLKNAVAPLEAVVHDFAVEVLKDVQSLIALNPNKEVQRLRAEVGTALSKIAGSGNQAAIELIKKDLSKLRSADNVTSSMEGITFQWKGDTYKLTGNFAPINQILGIFKYGRGKDVPPMA